jgi:flagellar hook-length control protein FliK
MIPALSPPAGTPAPEPRAVLRAAGERGVAAELFADAFAEDGAMLGGAGEEERATSSGDVFEKARRLVVTLGEFAGGADPAGQAPVPGDGEGVEDAIAGEVAGGATDALAEPAAEPDPAPPVSGAAPDTVAGFMLGAGEAPRSDRTARLEVASAPTAPVKDAAAATPAPVPTSHRQVPVGYGPTAPPEAAPPMRDADRGQLAEVRRPEGARASVRPQPAPVPVPVTPIAPVASPVAVVGAGAADGVFEALELAEVSTAAAGRTGSAGSPPTGQAPALAATAQSVAAQVTVAIRGAQQDRVEIRLDPPELGRVRIDLRMVEGVLQAVLTCERPEVQDLMRRHGEALQRDLEAAGYEGATLAFADGAEAGADPGDEDGRAPLVRPSTERAAVPQGIPARWLGEDGRLDIRL